MYRKVISKDLKIYNVNGKEPLNEWLDAIKDISTKVKILRRIDRLREGNYGEYRYLKGKLFELKINYGPGYRIYCGDNGPEIIILLCGGDKATQTQDIRKATIYLNDYFRRNL